MQRHCCGERKSIMLALKCVHRSFGTPPSSQKVEFNPLALNAGWSQDRQLGNRMEASQCVPFNPRSQGLCKVRGEGLKQPPC